jgi:hypothetical protein
MAKNKFVDIADLDDKKIKQVVKTSDMVKTAEHKGKGGRPVKEQKAEQFLNVYFTAEEKANVQSYCEKIHVSFSSFVKQVLAEKGVI